jgi:hypothetical protein
VIDDFFATPFSKLLRDELKEKYLQNDDRITLHFFGSQTPLAREDR